MTSQVHQRHRNPRPQGRGLSTGSVLNFLFIPHAPSPLMMWIALLPLLLATGLQVQAQSTTTERRVTLSGDADLDLATINHYGSKLQDVSAADPEARTKAVGHLIDLTHAYVDLHGEHPRILMIQAALAIEQDRPTLGAIAGHRLMQQREHLNESQLAKANAVLAEMNLKGWLAPDFIEQQQVIMQRYEAAREAIQDDRPKEAQAILEGLLAEAPSYEPARTLHQQLLPEADRQKAASLRAIAREMDAARSNNDTDALRESAKRYIDLSDEIIHTQPSLIEIWAYRAMAAVAIGDIDAGLEAGRQLEQARANSSVATKAMAELESHGWVGPRHRVYEAAAEAVYDEAVAAAEAIEDGFDRSSALLSLAKHHREAGDTEESQRFTQLSLDAVLSHQSDDPIMWMYYYYIDQIVEFQVASGDVEAAIQTIRSMPVDSQNSRIIRIAKDFAVSGDHEAARRCFEQALAWARARGDEYGIDRRQVAVGQAEAGYFEDARRTLLRLTDDQRKNHTDDVLVAIAKAQAAGGDMGSASATARSISSSRQQAWAWRDLANARAEAGDFSSAVETTHRITDTDVRVSALLNIARAQREAGDSRESRRTLDTALDLARTIGGHSDRTQALTDIAEEQTRNGDAAGGRSTLGLALEAARQISHESNRMMELRDIAEEYARAGDLPTAMSIAESLPRDRRGSAFMDIVFHLGESGDIAAASGVVFSITDKETRDLPLRQLAFAEIKQGNIKSALSRMQQIQSQTYSSQVLRDAVRAELEAGRLEAAIELVREYPAHADIAIWLIFDAHLEAGDVGSALVIAKARNDPKMLLRVSTALREAASETDGDVADDQ